MYRFRNQIKILIYKILGERIYQKAYILGKIRDIDLGISREDEMNLIHHFISSDSTVLDIGANYGHYTIELSRLVPKGKVYAFEPIPFTFRVLGKIISHFQSSNVSLIQAATYHDDGSVEMTLPLLDFGAPNTGLAYIGKNSDSIPSKLISVKKIRIDSLEIQGSVDFIKIDIEGQEPFAFAGMKNLIQKHNPIILMEFSHSCLKRAGFDLFEFSNELRTKWNYHFTRKKNSQLEFVGDDIPPDGYYFLVPQSKLENYQSLFQ